MLAKIRVGRTGIRPSPTKEQSELQDTTVSENGTEQLEHNSKMLIEQAESIDLATLGESPP
jgi:hypothetical protein